MSVDREREGGTPAGSVEIEGAMETGQGADDEPEMTIGDKYGDEVNDSETDEQGTLSVEEAAALLGANEDEQKREEA